MAVELSRKPLPKANELSDKLYAEYNKVFGTLDRYGDKVAFVKGSTPSLAHILRKMEIDPLDPKAVKAYKNKFEKKWTSYSAQRQVQMALGAIMLGFGLFCIVSMLRGNLHTAAQWVINILVALAGTVVGCIVLQDAFGDGNGKLDNSRSWSFDSLENHIRHEKYIPEFALSRAIQIKSLCPEADFKIHTLTSFVVQTKRVVHDPDPFMSVHLGSEFYYLDVWDEPEFERTL